MTIFIVNLTETPLTEQQINNLKEYAGPDNIVTVDETLQLTNESYAATLADTWATLSTRRGQEDNSFGHCDEMILIMPSNIYALALVQRVSGIAAECREKGIKHILPVYTMIQEDGCFVFLNG